MSVVIKNVKFPNSCNHCVFSKWVERTFFDRCIILDEEYDTFDHRDDRLPNCPLEVLDKDAYRKWKNV